MIYLPGLALATAALWFALSGETAPLFLFFGALSVLATLWLCARLGVIDRDASPYHRAPELLVYVGWLLAAIAKANVVVVRAILGPRGAINPAMVRVAAAARSDLGKVLFANSITLTPGTVTVDVADGQFLVHALQEEASRPASFAAMNRRAARAADGPE
jgi:multicomponent Na+:H+ antiporter subunit E